MKFSSRPVLTILIAFFACSLMACGQVAKSAVSANTPLPAPSKSITPADVAKLKWIEGTWRGMDGGKPFYERYRLDGTTLTVDGFADATLNRIESTGAFELKDGEFGKTEGGNRSVASFITDDAVQFGPAVPGKGNYFRFERQKNGVWNAVLEWPATADKPARSKIYVMERYAAPNQD